MSSIKETARLMKRALLVNLFTKDGLACTPLLEGSHGVGKTAIAHAIASDLNGTCIVIEGGSLKEGEITGLPMAQKNPDGSTQVTFVPYYQTARIQKLEKAIYERAKTEGFLNHTVYLDEEGNTHYTLNNVEHVIKAKSSSEKIINGTENQYEFGKNLPSELKLKLIDSGEIESIILLIDEMNRTDSQTMKELMNIVLTRNVNGYSFPWWVFIVAAINPAGSDSVYSANDMDPAQLDRFLKIGVTADLNEWVDYALDTGINDDYILALSTSPEVFQNKEYISKMKSEDMPTPRSHELCSYIYSSASAISKSSFFTQEEKDLEAKDVRDLIQYKLGNSAGRAIYDKIKNAKMYIKPSDILSGKDVKIDAKIIERLKAYEEIQLRVAAKGLIRYIAEDAIHYFYDSTQSKDTELAKKSKATWANILAQLKEFMGIIKNSTQLTFAKESVTTKVQLTDTKYKKHLNETIYASIATVFSMDIINQFITVNKMSSSGQMDVK